MEKTHTAAKTLYVADAGNNTIWLFPAGVNNPSPSGAITIGVDAPVGVWVDGAGTLYVANSRGGTGVGSITEYLAGQTSPSLTITNGIFRPVSVAVDRSGTLYVGQDGQFTPQIVAYAPGSTTPEASVFPTKQTGIPFMGGMGIDSAGNLFAAFFVYHKLPAHVVEFAPGLTNERDLMLHGLGGVDIFAGLALDGADNLYVGAPNRHIYAYQPGSQQPFKTIPSALGGRFVSDTAGNLYVPTGTEVDEYAAGAKTPFARVTSSLDIPEATAVR
ncbi:MAG: hypothetical protein JO043_05510 [Candidatus Eremiobacteraeota bacterium]|nr:hypothetical protein [Candidatus Eremiobacteraeota bacterium]